MAETLDLIKRLPQELREQIYKDFTEIKLKERKSQGWGEVHEELETIPFCEKRESFVKTLTCLEHEYCGIISICVPCSRKNDIYHHAFPLTNDEYTPNRYMEICVDEPEHYRIACKLKGLDPARELFNVINGIEIIETH